jgi:putative hemolysin
MMIRDMVLEVVLIFLLILANGFFSASEISLISARRGRMRHKAETGNEAGRLVYQLQNDPDRFLAAVQIGITLLGSLASAIGGVIAIEFLKPLLEKVPLRGISRSSESLSLLLVVLVITYLILVLGELVPKSLALKHSEKVALWVARPIDLFSRFSSPFIRILTSSNRLVLKALGLKGHAEAPLVSEDEVKMMVREGIEKGVFDQVEQQLIHSVFEFTDTLVKEVMVPRPRIQALQIDSPPSEILKTIQKAGFSRFPIYGKDLDDVRGILYSKDVLRLLAGEKPIILSRLLHPAYFVPETKMISDLMPELLRRRVHMALIVNEYGSVEGLITLEDLIEELIGEIHDEYEPLEAGVERSRDGSLLIEAHLSIHDLQSRYRLPFPESPDFETLAGFMLSQLQRIPQGGESVQYQGWKFTIVDVDRKRITKVKAEMAPSDPSGDDSEKIGPADA